MVEVQVNVPTVGRITHRGVLVIDDSENVFGRVLLFRQYMQKVFPGCDYNLVSAKQIKEGK